MSLFIKIHHETYMLPDSAPVTTMMKHLSNLRTLDFEKLGDEYVYVISDKAGISISNENLHRDVLTKTEYLKRLKAIRRAIPAKAGPDAHGHDITRREN